MREGIIHYQDFKLLGKTVMERVRFRPPLRAVIEFERESCFVFSVSGHSNLYASEEAARLSPGMGALIPCGNFVNRWRHVEGTAELNTAIALHFHPETLKEVYRDRLPGFLKQSGEDREHAMGVIRGNEALTKFMEGLLFYFDNPELVDEDLLRLKLKEMLLLLYKSGDPAVRGLLHQMFRPREFRFRETVETHLFSDLDSTDLAKLCGMSLANFKRKFKEVFGQPPMKYAKLRRLEHARELILNTKDSVGEICYRAGFNDLSHFNKSFKARFGKSPTAFRE